MEVDVDPDARGDSVGAAAGLDVALAERMSELFALLGDAPLREVLRGPAVTFPSDYDDPVSPVSVMSGKLADRATEGWSSAGVQRITPHECRYTYASFLMAAGYTLKELIEFMGHSDLQMVQRYTKLLPQPEEDDPAERLDAYLDGRRRG